MFLRRTRRRRSRSFWDLMRLTTRSMGTRRGGSFHGYYDGYCYLPLYVFCQASAGSEAAPVEHRRQRGAVEEMDRWDRSASSLAWCGSRFGRTAVLHGELMAGARATPLTTCLTGWHRACPVLLSGAPGASRKFTDAIRSELSRASWWQGRTVRHPALCGDLTSSEVSARCNEDLLRRSTARSVIARRRPPGNQLRLWLSSLPMSRMDALRRKLLGKPAARCV